MQFTVISWLKGNVALLALLLVSIIIYAPSISGDFVIDDVPFIKENPYIRNFSQVPRYFTKGLWENSALEEGSESMYRPLNLMPMLVNHALWGNHPAGYHVFLLILHLFNTVLVYVLVRRLANCSTLAAALGAAAFAMHPARVESVAWISGGIDPLVTFFLLVALLTYFNPLPSQRTGKRWVSLVVSLFAFQLALWSKEVAIIFPVIVVAYDWIYRKKFNVGMALAHLAIVAIYLLSRSLVLGATGKWSDLDFTHWSKVMDFGFGYSEMLMFPIDIPLYIQPPEQMVPSGLGILSAILVVGAIGGSWVVFDKQRRGNITFAVCWTLGFLWPAVLLSFYRHGFFAGRFLYVPAFGLALFLALLYDYWVGKYPHFKIMLNSMGVLLIVCYGWADWKSIPAWHDGGTIYRKIAHDSPENAIGYIGMGDYYLAHGNLAEAEKNFLLAVNKAKSPQLSVPSLISLGMINGMNNKIADSERFLKQALSIDPNSSNGWAGLGNLAQMKGDLLEAIDLYQKAIDANAKNYEATFNLAAAYEQVGQFQRAEFIRQRAAAIPH